MAASSDPVDVCKKVGRCCSRVCSSYIHNFGPRMKINADEGRQIYISSYPVSERYIACNTNSKIAGSICCVSNHQNL